MNLNSSKITKINDIYFIIENESNLDISFFNCFLEYLTICIRDGVPFRWHTEDLYELFKMEHPDIPKLGYKVSEDVLQFNFEWCLDYIDKLQYGKGYNLTLRKPNTKIILVNNLFGIILAKE